MSNDSERTPAILIVDDESIILLSLRQELRRYLGHTFELLTATDGEEALQIISELSNNHTNVVLVITDWLMPGMNGDELVNRVRADHPSVRTIMLSGMVEDSIISGLRESGVLDAYVSKPWSSEKLVGVCRRVLGLSA